jgi:hypothetical protein
LKNTLFDDYLTAVPWGKPVHKGALRVSSASLSATAQSGLEQRESAPKAAGTGSKGQGTPFDTSSRRVI